MAELVDAADSKSVDLTIVLVRFRPGAPKIQNAEQIGVFFVRFDFPFPNTELFVARGMVLN